MPGRENNKPLRCGTPRPEGLILAGGIRSIGSTPHVRGPIDFPCPNGIGPTRCSGILQSDSRGQRPHDRQPDVEPPDRSASTPSRRRLPDRGLDRVRAREPILSPARKTRNRERFPKSVTFARGFCHILVERALHCVACISLGRRGVDRALIEPGPRRSPDSRPRRRAVCSARV